jgi:L-fuconolactonase
MPPSATGANCAPTGASLPDRLTLVDAQVHIWGAVDPHGTGLATHGELLKADDVVARMDAAGVAGAVLVPPLSDPGGNAAALAAATRRPDRFAVMGRVDLARPPAGGELDVPPGGPLRGYRIAFVGDTRDLLKGDDLEWFWSAAERMDIPVMIFAHGLWSRVAAVAERHPRLRLAVDHLNLCPQVRDEDLPPLVAETVKLARLPNVSVKLTALPTYSSDPYPFRNLHDVIYRVVDAYGPQRCFWGSDLSRLSCTYAELIGLFTKELCALTADERRLIMGGSLLRWLNWDGPARDTGEERA